MHTSRASRRQLDQWRISSEVQVAEGDEEFAQYLRDSVARQR
ncbi:MAG TPA: hypothetical protein VE092_07840 [Herbaspirillum sp.]|nr:hypothetical protein [Herbaspirillum sp.]HZG19918.1 hypothetical protein [Herbaspirillum sp.]